MSDKKVYRVELTVEKTMMVVAASEEEAEETACELFAEELEIDEVDANAVRLLCVPLPYASSIPWGTPDDDPRRDWTVAKWFEEQK